MYPAHASGLSVAQTARHPSWPPCACPFAAGAWKLQTLCPQRAHGWTPPLHRPRWPGDLWPSSQCRLRRLPRAQNPQESTWSLQYGELQPLQRLMWPRHF
mmetsp:Transcript_106824/g.297385  ORF Transcript_106824/g.297385 Transcript_106824/m.297385 type:complete len:100 (+) Transcript_106824:1004-1303(+)